MTDFPKLLIVSHVIHYEHEGRIYAYGPYAREIELWAQLFSEVTIASPVRPETPPADCIAFRSRNISMARQLETGGDTMKAKISQIAALPLHAWRISRSMSRADVVHVRCPGNLGLIGVVLAPLFSRRMVAKYAGQWWGGERIPLTYRMQRWILSSRWWRRGVVTVYGEWPDQPRQVVPFFTSMMTREQVTSAVQAAGLKAPLHPARILYSGRLVPGKGIDVLIRAAAQVQEAIEVTVVGEGPESDRLRQLALELGVAEKIKFAGAVAYDEVMEFYRQAHILVLASNSEGWPKVLPEAMCHGVVCIATDQGLMPWMLKNRGETVAAGDSKALAGAIDALIRDPQRYARLAENAMAWAQRYSLEDLKEALRNLLSGSWNLELPAGNVRRPAISQEISS